LYFFLSRLRKPGPLAILNQKTLLAVAIISPALDAAAAARAARALGRLRRLPDSEILWPDLSTALVAVCRRLPAPTAAAHVNRTVDFIIKARAATKEKDKYNYTYQAVALGTLAGRLDAARAARAAGAIIAILGDGPVAGGVKYSFLSYGSIAAALTHVAKRLDAAGCRRVAEDLVLLLRKPVNIVSAKENLRAALVALCRRLDAAGAARVAKDLVAAALDPKTSVLARTLFADALAALAGRLTKDQAASLESALVDSLLADLADAKSREFRGFLGQALATACGRAGATGAARAAKALAAAFCDPQTPLPTLKPLAAALAVVSGRLPPREASAHAKKAVAVFDSLWAARKAPLDRAALAEALAVMWPRLGRTAAAARAKRAAADLEGALRDSKATPNQIAGLAKALAAVYSHLDPAGRGGRAKAVADALVVALRKPKSNPYTTYQLWEAIAALGAHLNRPGAARTADVLLALLDDPNVQQDSFLSYEKMFKKVAARLGERDLRRLLEHPLAVGRLQRALLDVLPGSKNRPFRNTWDYLDGTESNEN
jgi:hypothetical protein